MTLGILHPRLATWEAYGHTEGVLSTPRKAKELQASLTAAGKATLTQRRLFRKVGKAFDEKDFLIASQKREIEELKSRMERIKPTKRKKVVPDPNSIFATIEDIRKAQQEAGRSVSPSLDSLSSDLLSSESSEAGDCIEAVR